MRVQQVSKDTGCGGTAPARVPTLARMTTQYLSVPASSASPERLFSSMGLVTSDLRGSILDTTWIDAMWAKRAP